MTDPKTPRRVPVPAELPTAQALDIARRAAHRACADQAFAHGWPMTAAGHAVMDRAPFVALEALARRCPGVDRMVLARCLKLDPHTAPDLLDNYRQAPGWPVDAVGRVLAAFARAG